GASSHTEPLSRLHENRLNRTFDLLRSDRLIRKSGAGRGGRNLKRERIREDDAVSLFFFPQRHFWTRTSNL
ncbi:MAG TPA: hypothetical protein VJ023_00915, partial [Pyrinomonadaceae bacterium]|nr:hypothetical protein [Pyrinomonadaceae bacterium]